MNTRALKWGLAGLAAVALLVTAPAQADVTVTVNPASTWNGYMNVSEIPANGGAFLWGSGWGIPDLSANWTGGVVKLTPNSINDPNPYWYTPAGGPGAAGNKTMEANLYVEDSLALVGQTVHFEGYVQNNTLTSAHTAVAFIKDFAPDYSSFNVTSIPLAPGAFSISLATDPTPGRHVQYGFQMTGPCVWVTDLPQFGAVNVAAPEPTTLVSLALLGGLVLRRRR